MNVQISTPCGLQVPRIDQLKCLEERSTVVITYNDIDASSVYIEDRLWRTINIQAARDLADRVTYAQDYWLKWHDEYCDCRCPQ